MPIEYQEILTLLSQVPIFSHLDDYGLNRVARLMHREFYQYDEDVFNLGDASQAMYVLLDGRIDLTNTEEDRFATLGEGYIFGEEALLFDDPRYYRAVARKDTRLLRLDVEDYLTICDEFPGIEERLEVAIRSRALALQVNLPWMQNEEFVHILTRRHPAILTGKLILPVLFILLAGVFSFLVQFHWLPERPYGWLTFIVSLIVGILWVIWRIIDWRNDYFIVTNKRVVWIEKVALIHESRQEAPLSTIMSIGLQRSRIASLFGFADVVVMTFVGTIRLRDLAHADVIASLIETYWRRTKSRDKFEEAQMMEQILGEKLGFAYDRGENTQVRALAQDGQAEGKNGEKEPGFFAWLFSDFIRLRYETSGAIIYRKHWFILVKRIWLPLGMMLASLAIGVGLVGGLLDFISINPAMALIAMILLSCFVWMTYQYADWRNDLFKITHDQIIDIDRKPLGKVRRRAAPLENVLSIEYERLGFWGFLFNFGTVYISVGNTRLTFDHVYQPSEVQQDIFYRMGERLETMRQFEIDAERERISEWIASYHRGNRQFKDNNGRDSQNEVNNP